MTKRKEINKTINEDMKNLNENSKETIVKAINETNNYFIKQ